MSVAAEDMVQLRSHLTYILKTDFPIPYINQNSEPTTISLSKNTLHILRLIRNFLECKNDDQLLRKLINILMCGN